MQPEMERLIEELTSESFEDAHPLVQAAYAHYAFVAIHRSLTATAASREPWRPFISPRSERTARDLADDRPRYFESLSTADQGNYEPFTEFVADAGIATVELVTDSLRTAGMPTPEEAVEKFRELEGELTYTDIDAVANGILPPRQALISEEIAALNPPGGVQITNSGGTDQGVGTPDGYRPLPASPGQFVGIDFSSPPPSQAHRQARFYVFVSRSREEDAELFWILRVGTEEGVTFSLRDVYPRLTTAAEQRL